MYSMHKLHTSTTTEGGQAHQEHNYVLSELFKNYNLKPFLCLPIYGILCSPSLISLTTEVQVFKAKSHPKNWCKQIKISFNGNHATVYTSCA